MMMKKGVLVYVMVVVAMVQLMLEPSVAINCADVARNLVQCTPYVTGATPEPAKECCTGVSNLRGMATTTPERRAACNCIKEAASRYPNLKDDAVSALPGKCGAQLPFPISKTFDCNSIP